MRVLVVAAGCLVMAGCGSSTTSEVTPAPDTASLASASATGSDWVTQANAACVQAQQQAGQSPTPALDVDEAKDYGQPAQIQALAAQYLKELTPDSDDAAEFTKDMQEFAGNSSQIAAADVTGSDTQALQTEQETLKNTMTELGTSLGVDQCVALLEGSQELLQ